MEPPALAAADLELPPPTDTTSFTDDWSRAGASLDDRYTTPEDAGGVRLTVSAAPTGDSNVYTLQANNAEGDSGKILLDAPEEAPTGEDPPTFLRRLQDLTVKVGSRTRFLVEIISSTECKVTWYRNERRLLEAERVALARDGNFWCADVAAVSVDDTGRWTCTAENAGGRASCSAHLNVLVPKAYKRPEFVEELRALLTEQGTVSLECKVVGVPTPVLRWFKDSREIKAGDVFALTANAEDPTSLGTYTCEAVNCMGRAYSSSKVHVVGRASREGSARPSSSGMTPELPPIFTKELEDAHVKVCEHLTLGCHIVVPPWPRSVVWYNKDGKVEPGERYHVLEDGVGGYLLEIPSAEWADEGEWKCVATSAGGRVGISTCYVAMDVPKNYRKPRFMENLQAVLTEEGLVSFECKVVGFPTPVLSWFKDGQELKPGDVYQLTGTNSLGSYCCIARNCMGKASSSAELTVEDIQNQLNEEEKLQLFSKNQAPKFLQGLKSVEAKIDEPFRFIVKVAIPPEPSVLWYRDDQPVDESTRCHLDKEEKGLFNLDIQNLEFLDQAEWKCVAMNDFGHSVTSCFLKLIIPRHYKKPRFLENLQAILSDEGAVNLECKVIGVPQPILKWYKDGEELKPGDIHRIISGQDGTCCLGTYTCEAQNCMGIAASSASLLGFDDSMKTKTKKPEEQPLQRNLSLSTIHEERTSQMYDTPVGDITLDDKGEISFSFDGKEVSVSLYETPDLTEEEALQIVEMYADQLSENVTEHNVVELPPLRFVKETSTSGNLLMEAIIIDVSPDYFATPDEDLRTEADVEDLSIADEIGPPQLSLDQDIEIGGEDYLEKTMTLLSEERSEFAAKSSRKKSDSQRSVDDFFSLSRDQSLSEEKRDDDTHISESELQSFASARSSAKIKSKSLKQSGEEGQESSEPTKTILFKEAIDLKSSNKELAKQPEQEVDVSVIKPKRERRTSRGSRKSSTSSEKSISKSREELLRLKTDIEQPSKKIPMNDEEFKNTMNNISTSLVKVINDVQLIEKDIILKSELMSSAATASRSLEIISSLITPLSEIHSISDAAKESVSESKEITSSIFNSISQPLKTLQQSLTIIEKCIDMESDNKTLVKKTCVAFIETCGLEIQKAISDITSVMSQGYLLCEDKTVNEIDSVASEMNTIIKFSSETIKARNLLAEASEIKSEEPTLETKHIRDTQKAVFELKSPLNSLLLIVESAENGQLTNLTKIKNSEVIMNDMSASIQDLQTALEQIESLSVKESSASLQNYNTEIIETVMDSVLKLRGSFELLSTKPNIEEDKSVFEQLSSLKQNLTDISQKIEVVDNNIGQFDVLHSENKLEILQKMAQILIALENNLPRLEIMPEVKSQMDTFHKNLTKVLEKVIESNEAQKYITMMEICNTVKIINSAIKNIDSESVLPLASLSNTLKVIQNHFIKNIFESDLNCSILNNISDVLVGIEEAINKAEEVSLKIDSDYIEEFSNQIIDETKVNIILEHIDQAIVAVNTIKTFESTRELKLSLTPALENICPILEELKRSVASVRSSGVEQDEHISEISEASFIQTIATPLCELNQNIIVLNQLIIENIDYIKENAEIITALANPLHELHITLEILQQDVISQYEDDLTPYEVSVNMASVVQNLQSCIVMIHEQAGIEGADEMSTLEDISGIKTTADTLPSDRLVLPTAEETAIEQSLPPFCIQEIATTATAQTLQTLNEHIIVLQTPDIIEALDTLSEVSDYSSLKSVVVGLGDLYSGLEGILHPVPIEGSIDLEELVNISKLAAIAEPMQEIHQSLSVLDTNNIPIYENILDLPTEKIHSVFQSISEFKNSLERCMCAVLPALEITNNTIEISNKVSTLREVCEQLKEIFETSKDATTSDITLPPEVHNLKIVVDSLIDATDVSKDIKIDDVKCITEDLYMKVVGVQEDIIQFTALSSEQISQEAKLIQIVNEVERNIAVLEQYDFIDLSRASDIPTACMSPQMAFEIDSESLAQIHDIAENAVNVLHDSYQEIPDADIMIVEDFFRTCKNEFTILRCLISKATSHKKIIRLLQEFNSLQTMVNNFTIKRLELRLSDDVNECLTNFLIHADECLRNARNSLIKVVDSQTDMLIKTPLIQLESINKHKHLLEGQTIITIKDVIKCLMDVVETTKSLGNNLQCDIIEELSYPNKIPRPNPEEIILMNKMEELAIIVDDQSKSLLNVDSSQKILEQLTACINKHHDYKDALGTGKTLIVLKCLAECVTIVHEEVTEDKICTYDDTEIKGKENSLKEVLAEMLQPLQALQTQLINIQEQVVSGAEEDSISIDITTTESIMQTMNELHKDIVQQLDLDKSTVDNEDISLIMEVDKEIHSIQDSIKSMENVQAAQAIKEITKPMGDIEKSLHTVLSSDKDTLEETLPKEPSIQLLHNIDQYIELIEIVEELSAVIKIEDLKETFDIACKLRDSITAYENSPVTNDVRTEQASLAHKLQIGLSAFQVQVLDSTQELTSEISTDTLQRIAQVTAQLQTNLIAVTGVNIAVQAPALLIENIKTESPQEPFACSTTSKTVVVDKTEVMFLEQIYAEDKNTPEKPVELVEEEVELQHQKILNDVIAETETIVAETQDNETREIVQESLLVKTDSQKLTMEVTTDIESHKLLMPQPSVVQLGEVDAAWQENLMQHIDEYVSEDIIEVVNELSSILNTEELTQSVNIAKELRERISAIETCTNEDIVHEINYLRERDVELIQGLQSALSVLSEQTLEQLHELVPSYDKDTIMKIVTVTKTLKNDLLTAQVVQEETCQAATQKNEPELEQAQLVKKDSAETLEQATLIPEDTSDKISLKIAQCNVEENNELIPAEHTSDILSKESLDTSEVLPEPSTVIKEELVKQDEIITEETSVLFETKHDFEYTATQKENEQKENLQTTVNEGDLKILDQSSMVGTIEVSQQKPLMEKPNDEMLLQQAGSLQSAKDNVIVSEATNVKEEIPTLDTTLGLSAITEDSDSAVVVLNNLVGVGEILNDPHQGVIDINATVVTEAATVCHQMEPVVKTTSIPVTAQDTEKSAETAQTAETLIQNIDAFLSNDLLHTIKEKLVNGNDLKQAVLLAKDLKEHIIYSQINTLDELKIEPHFKLDSGQAIIAQQLHQALSNIQVQLLDNFSEKSFCLSAEEQCLDDTISQLADYLMITLFSVAEIKSANPSSQDKKYNIINEEIHKSQILDNIISMSSNEDGKANDISKDINCFEATDDFTDCHNEPIESYKETDDYSNQIEGIELKTSENILTETTKCFEEFFDSPTSADKIPSSEFVAAEIAEVTLLENTKTVEKGLPPTESASLELSDSLVFAITDVVNITETKTDKNEQGFTEIIVNPEVEVSLSNVAFCNKENIEETTAEENSVRPESATSCYDAELNLQQSFIDTESKIPSAKIVKNMELVESHDTQIAIPGPNKNIEKKTLVTEMAVISISDNLTCAVTTELDVSESSDIGNNLSSTFDLVDIGFDSGTPLLDFTIGSTNFPTETKTQQEIILQENIVGCKNTEPILLKDTVKLDNEPALTSTENNQNVLEELSMELMEPFVSPLANDKVSLINLVPTSNSEISILEHTQNIVKMDEASENAILRVSDNFPLAITNEVNVLEATENNNVAISVVEAVIGNEVKVTKTLTEQEDVVQVITVECNGENNESADTNYAPESSEKYLAEITEPPMESLDLPATANKLPSSKFETIEIADETVLEHATKNEREQEDTESAILGVCDNLISTSPTDLNLVKTTENRKNDKTVQIDEEETTAQQINMTREEVMIDEQTVLQIKKESSPVSIDLRNLIHHIDAFLTDEVIEIVNEISNITNAEELNRCASVAIQLRESVMASDYRVAAEEATPINENKLLQQALLVQDLQDGLSILHKQALENAQVITPIITPESLQKLSEIISHLQEDLATTIVIEEVKIIEVTDVEEEVTEQNSLAQLETLLQEVNKKIHFTSENKLIDTDDSESLKDTLDEVQTVIIKLKREYDGAANDTLNETLEDLECSVRSVQLQINEESPPELLTEACATLQLLVDNMNATQDLEIFQTVLKTETILDKCSNETEETVKLLDVASKLDTMDSSNLNCIISNLSTIRDSLKTLRESFLVDAETVIENGVKIVQCLDRIEDNIFSLERQIDIAGNLKADARDIIITAVHSVYGSISNMRSTISSVQKRYMYENYGKPSESLLYSIKNITIISKSDDDNDNVCWKRLSKSLRKVLKHFEDIKFYINLDKTARLPNDAAFTKIILVEFKENILSILLPRAMLINSIAVQKVNCLLKCVEKHLENIESNSSLEVKNKIPIFKEIAAETLASIGSIKNHLEKNMARIEDMALEDEPPVIKKIKDENIDSVQVPQIMDTLKEQQSETVSQIVPEYKSITETSATEKLEVKQVDEELPSTSDYVQGDVLKTTVKYMTEDKILIPSDKQSSILEIQTEMMSSENVEQNNNIDIPSVPSDDERFTLNIAPRQSNLINELIGTSEVKHAQIPDVVFGTDETRDLTLRPSTSESTTKDVVQKEITTIEPQTDEKPSHGESSYLEAEEEKHNLESQIFKENAEQTQQTKENEHLATQIQEDVINYPVEKQKEDKETGAQQEKENEKVTMKHQQEEAFTDTEEKQTEKQDFKHKQEKEELRLQPEIKNMVKIDTIDDNLLQNEKEDTKVDNETRQQKENDDAGNENIQEAAVLVKGEEDIKQNQKRDDDTQVQLEKELAVELELEQKHDNQQKENENKLKTTEAEANNIKQDEEASQLKEREIIREDVISSQEDERLQKEKEEIKQMQKQEEARVQQLKEDAIKTELQLEEVRKQKEKEDAELRIEENKAAQIKQDEEANLIKEKERIQEEILSTRNENERLQREKDDIELMQKQEEARVQQEKEDAIKAELQLQEVRKQKEKEDAELRIEENIAAQIKQDEEAILLKEKERIQEESTRKENERLQREKEDIEQMQKQEEARVQQEKEDAIKAELQLQEVRKQKEKEDAELRIEENIAAQIKQDEEAILLKEKERIQEESTRKENERLQREKVDIEQMQKQEEARVQQEKEDAIKAELQLQEVRKQKEKEDAELRIEENKAAQIKQHEEANLLKEKERIQEESTRHENERLQREKDDIEQMLKQDEARVQQEKEDAIKAELQLQEVRKQKEKEDAELRIEENKAAQIKQDEEAILLKEKERIQEESTRKENERLQREKDDIEQMQKQEEARVQQEKEDAIKAELQLQEVRKQKEKEDAELRIEENIAAQIKQDEEAILLKEKERIQEESTRKENERLQREKDNIEQMQKQEEARVQQEKEDAIKAELQLQEVRKQKEKEDAELRIEETKSAQIKQDEEANLLKEKERIQEEILSSRKENERLQSEKDDIELMQKQEEARVQQEKEDAIKAELQLQEVRKQKEKEDAELRIEENKAAQVKQDEEAKLLKEKESTRKENKRLQREKEDIEQMQKQEEARVQQEKEDAIKAELQLEEVRKQKEKEDAELRIEENKAAQIKQDEEAILLKEKERIQEESTRKENERLQREKDDIEQMQKQEEARVQQEKEDAIKAELQLQEVRKQKEKEDAELRLEENKAAQIKQDEEAKLLKEKESTRKENKRLQREKEDIEQMQKQEEARVQQEKEDAIKAELQLEEVRKQKEKEDAELRIEENKAAQIKQDEEANLLKEKERIQEESTRHENERLQREKDDIEQMQKQEEARVQQEKEDAIKAELQLQEVRKQKEKEDAELRLEENKAAQIKQDEEAKLLKEKESTRKENKRLQREKKDIEQMQKQEEARVQQEKEDAIKAELELEQEKIRQEKENFKLKEKEDKTAKIRQEKEQAKIKQNQEDVLNKKNQECLQKEKQNIEKTQKEDARVQQEKEDADKTELKLQEEKAREQKDVKLKRKKDKAAKIIQDKENSLQKEKIQDEANCGKNEDELLQRENEDVEHKQKQEARIERVNENEDIEQKARVQQEKQNVAKAKELQSKQEKTHQQSEKEMQEDAINKKNEDERLQKDIEQKQNDEARAQQEKDDATKVELKLLEEKALKEKNDVEFKQKEEKDKKSKKDKQTKEKEEANLKQIQEVALQTEIEETCLQKNKEDIEQTQNDEARAQQEKDDATKSELKLQEEKARKEKMDVELQQKEEKVRKSKKDKKTKEKEEANLKQIQDDTLRKENEAIRLQKEKNNTEQKKKHEQKEENELRIQQGKEDTKENNDLKLKEDETAKEKVCVKDENRCPGKEKGYAEINLMEEESRINKEKIPAKKDKKHRNEVEKANQESEYNEKEKISVLKEKEDKDADLKQKKEDLHLQKVEGNDTKTEMTIEEKPKERRPRNKKVDQKMEVAPTEKKEMVSFDVKDPTKKNEVDDISKKATKYTERLDKNERRDDELHIYKKDPDIYLKKENGDVSHINRRDVSHEQHYIREYQYDPSQIGNKLETRERPRFVDHNHRDYTMEFARPSGYHEKSFDLDKPDSYSTYDLGKKAAIYRAQTIVLDAKLRSSAPPYPDTNSSRISEPTENRSEIRNRSKALSEARSIIPEKRTGLSRDSKRKPVFSTYLTDRTAVEGSRVKLTCSVLSSTEPTVTWYKNGVILDNKLKYRTKFMDGLVTLEVLNAVPSDSAEYSCTIVNENGSVNSSATLKVYPSFEASPIPPTFTRSIRDTYHLAENELVLECRIRGQPLPTITWLKDDKLVSTNSRFQAYYLADGVCRLAIEHPTPEDSGKYTCKAENSVWSDQIMHVVNFTGRESRLSPNLTTIEKSRFNRQAMESRRPHFTNVLSDYKVVQGGTIGLQVEIRGAPTRVEWLREGCSVTEVYRNARTFVEQGLYTLALSDVTEKESGMYTCRAWSSQSHVDMNAAITVVQPNELDGKPAIIVGRPEKDILISVGEDVNISFRVQGEPRPKVVFMKGIRDITTNQRVCKMTSDDYVKFTLKRSVVSDAGTYCILARNAYGCDRAFVTVVVRQRASSDNLVSDWTYPIDDSTMSIAERKYKSVPERIPGVPSVVEGGNNWLSLGWPKSEPGPSAPVLAYKIESWLLGKEGGARWVELGITPLTSFDAFNLKQGEEYHFRVTPRNRYGWGESVQTNTPIGVGLAGDRPEFSESLPGQLKILVGETANLSCSVKGKPVPEVIWMKNGHEIEDEDRRLSSSFNGFNCCLTIKDINTEDEARYSCEATNVHGRASTYARLAVVTDRSVWEADAKLKRERSADVEGDYPPQFTMRLRDRRVQATYPVRLTCQVIGSPDPGITWFKDGEEVKPDNRRSHFQDEHFRTLEIAPTTLEDGGVYEAMARNSSGAVSCHCNLVVDKGIRAYVAPEFCCGLEPLYRLTDGEELRISAVVEAYPSVGVTWYRDGVRLRPSRRAIMTLDRDGQIELALAAVTSRDAGVYMCTASNEVGRASTSGKVEVTGTNVKRVLPVFISPDEPYSKEPMFIRKPRSSEAREGDTVIIACEVVGDPKPDVYWLRDFLKPDYYRDATHFKRMGDGPEYRFEIPHAKLDYTGAYSVVARNQHGEAKAVISLQILAKDPSSSDDAHNIRYGRVEVLPRFTKELTDLLSCDGDAVQFECRLSGHPEPHVKWFHYHELIRDCSDFETSFDEGTARLKIKQVTADDEGTYTCEAANNLGKATCSACLVVYPPGEPNTLSQRLRRPPALLSAASTPRSTPRSTPARSVSRTPGPESRRLCSPARTLAPSFYTYPFNKVAEEGDSVSLQCAIKGNPAPWATWDKDGVIITPSSRITIKEKDDVLRVLEIDQVTVEDVGVYRITIENEFGRQEASARIEVITQRGKFYAGVRAVSPSPRKSLTYRGRRPSTPRQD